MREEYVSTQLGRKITAIFVTVIAVILVPFLLMNTLEKVDANEVVIFQYPTGSLKAASQPGIYGQWFGKVTSYPRRSMYSFTCDEKKVVEMTEQSGRKYNDEVCIPEKDHRLTVRFNDGGHADMAGSIQYEMPLDEKNLLELHKRFGSPEAVQKQLVETVVNKSVYMTGPLMSSKESYAERRNSLINYVADQVENGVYRTRQKEVQTIDPITNEKKTVTVVEIVEKNGVPERQEHAQLITFGIKPFNFSITELDYEQRVEDQIRQQQQLAMDVQTAIAEAKKAEQRAVTTKSEGEANAAAAKWEQEKTKAKEVTAAEQRKAVAELDVKTAELRKQEQILIGEGEAKRRQLVMNADGALDAKLRAYVEVQKVWADAVKGYGGNWVPSIQMGGGAQSTPGGGANDLINLLMTKTARDLEVDLSKTTRQQPSAPAVTKAGGGQR